MATQDDTALPLLALEPWELPAFAPGTPIFASASARFLVGEQTYVVRLIQNWVVFREEYPHAVNRFHKLLKDDSSHQSWESVPAQVREQLFERVFGLVVTQGKRLFYLDSNFQLVQNGEWQYSLELSAKNGRWKSKNSKETSYWYLPVESISELLLASPAEVVQEVLCWKNDSNTDCAFAFEWVTHDWSWQMSLVLGISQEQFYEFEELIRIATKSDDELVALNISWTIEI